MTDVLNGEGLIETEFAAQDDPEPADLTRAPMDFPAERDLRLQNLARGDEGFLLALGYSTQRGYGRNHPFAGEIRMGDVAVEIVPEELGFPIEIGEIALTECEMINQFAGSEKKPPSSRGCSPLAARNERRWRWHLSTGRCGRQNSARRRMRRHRMRNSFFITAITSKRRGLCSTLSCRITLISSPSWNSSANCARPMLQRARKLRNRRPENAQTKRNEDQPRI